MIVYTHTITTIYVDRLCNSRTDPLFKQPGVLRVHDFYKIKVTVMTCMQNYKWKID